MPSPVFVHLRLHSEYSITDGMARIDEAVDAAIADGMPALALTDLSNFSGLVKFYKKTRGKGLKPVAGVDVFITNEADRDRPYRLLLLCQSSEGYLRLCRLLSRAYLSNQYRERAELRREWFKDEGTEGLIALSGAHLGDVGCALMSGNVAEARRYAQGWAALFEDRYYIEVQRAGFADEAAYVDAATALAAGLDLPVVATHPVQFLTSADFKAHEARVCIAEGYVLNDKRREKAFTAQQYFKTQAEMSELFADLPEALQNSVEIARRCNLTLVLGKPRLPDFPTPSGESLDDFMLSESERGLADRMAFLYPDEAERAEKFPQYHERLLFEINTIIKMGFPGYFLIVADFIRWAKAYRSDAFPNGVPVGPGRGSGAGSLVAYCLLITDLDPLRYELLFERFLNPERVSMPDFDVDFCQDGRELVIDYVKQKYGAACVSQIATFGTMASKAVIRDVGRVMEFPYGLCDRLSKAIPLEGVKPVSLQKAREMEPEINAIAESEEGVPELLELAMRLEDLTRNVGMHAGGVVIAPGKLTDFCPLYCADGGASVVSQFDKDDVEAIGLVKFDFLGLRTLTIIDWAVRHIHRLQARDRKGLPRTTNETTTELLREGSRIEDQTQVSTQSSVHNPQLFSIEAIPLDDKPSYDLLKKCNTTAVFQLESRGMKDLIKRLQPDTFEDIVALVALFRPGPLESGMVDDFVDRKHGRATADYFHPELEASLKPTYGVIVYQEQVMQISQIIGGYTLGGADMLRRAMGKKDPAEMARQRDIFVSGALNREIDKDLATRLFDLMEMFAGYGFNKSHSAAYALVAYQTAYLKAHHPAAFMAATLSGDLDNTEKVRTFYADTLQQGITILLPDVNSSGYAFSPTDEKTISYGLGAIKGTGEAAIASIVKARATGPFKDLFDFCRRVDKRAVNRRTIETLIRAGAFDSINDHRAALMASVDAALASADQQARSINQDSLFGEDDADAVLIEQKSDVPRWSLREQLAFEKVSLGIYLGGHPYQEYEKELTNFIKVRLGDLTPAFLGKNSGSGGYVSRRGVQVRLAGIVSGLRLQQTRRGRMAVITLDDGSAQIELTVFNEEYEKSRQWIVEDELLVVEGKASLDEYSGNIRVSGEELFNFAQARSRFARQLELHCNSSVNIAQLKEILKPWSGGACAVQINYNNEVAVCQLRLGTDWQVTLDEALMRDLGVLLQPGNMQVVYG
ncbi:DNA polymerase III subunit alpha [Gallionella capsiferriformans]|uniref:DNA polymerase III subunit alpha n=1 Tax=Gallionella capsiferriformans (strain ES-2) TaxID=395494 RepID=D9SJU5_GALCS|nr:DNA polymerase III subunit alpha [Gallionella capsiferriformans]ADL54444.1 DNA polymerase III, alpha subunit [Gallionella capsiferriformans ES-2]